MSLTRSIIAHSIEGRRWVAARHAAIASLRATYPRLREDQLQRFSWLVLIPLSLALIMGVAVAKVAF